MSEEAYQSETAEVSLKLSQPHVRDVWEERMPLALEAALSVGCVASVAPAVRSRPLSEGYELVELQVCTSIPAPTGSALCQLIQLCNAQLPILQWICNARYMPRLCDVGKP